LCAAFYSSYKHGTTLPAFAAVRHAAAASAVQQSIDISHLPGPQQQTRREIQFCRSLNMTTDIDRRWPTEDERVVSVNAEIPAVFAGC